MRRVCTGARYTMSKQSGEDAASVYRYLVHYEQTVRRATSDRPNLGRQLAEVAREHGGRAAGAYTGPLFGST
jgi:hypothetical protein